jgi:hypothetical protein
MSSDYKKKELQKNKRGGCMSKYSKAVLSLALTAVLTSTAFAAVSPPTPSYPPLKGEFYPVEGQQYPQKKTNPYAHIRTVPFEGEPIEVYLQIDNVTQIQFPAPPVMVHIGKPEGFVVDTVVEFNSVFVKPVQEIEATNMIVTTERGVYVIILKENPYLPYDARVVVNDPYRNVRPDDVQTLVWSAYYGRRPAEFQFIPMTILSPDTAGYVYDPITRLGCRVSLQRVVCFPRSRKTVYWVRIMNVLPPQVKDKDVPVSSFMVDERSVWTQNIEKIVVPGTQTSGVPLLNKGDYIDMFMIVNSGQVPNVFNFRFALQGNRMLPIAVSLPTTPKAGGKKNFAPAKTIDEKLQEMYQEVQKKKQQESAAQQQQTAPAASTNTTQSQSNSTSGTVLYFPE